MIMDSMASYSLPSTNINFFRLFLISHTHTYRYGNKMTTLPLIANVVWGMNESLEISRDTNSY